MVLFFIFSGVAAVLVYKGYFKVALALIAFILLLCLLNFFFHMTTNLEMRW